MLYNKIYTQREIVPFGFLEFKILLQSIHKQIRFSKLYPPPFLYLLQNLYTSEVVNNICPHLSQTLLSLLYEPYLFFESNH